MKISFSRANVGIFLCVLFFSRCLYADATVSSFNHTAADVTYLLGPGDLLKVNVYNQQDLSGEYQVSGTGVLSLPLIGVISVKGLTLDELESKLIDKLSPDYLLNPRVSLQVLNFRPFYILGEVADPKSYSYVDGMTYLNAVAIAGGYTYRAKKSYVYVIRGNDPERTEIKVNMDQKVMPGDTIRVDERFF